MNLKQRIILGVTLGFILGCMGLWAVTGFGILTKTKVPVETVDPLFGTRRIEWRNTFVFGLDYAGPVAAAGAVAGGALLFALRPRKK